MAIFRKLIDMFDSLDRILITVSKFGVFLMMTLVSADVISRTFFNHSIAGVTEFSQDYLMVGVTYCAMAACYVIGGHVRVTLLITHISKKIMKPINIVLGLCGFTYFAIIAWSYYGVTINAYLNGEISNGLVKYPMAPAYFLVFMGAVLMCIRLLQYLPEPPEDLDEVNLE